MLLPRLSLVLAFAIFAVGCATRSESGGLYRESESGARQLADSKIQLETTGSFKRRAKASVRTMLARDGVVHATVDTGQRQGEAEIPADVYAALWRDLMADKAMTLTVEPPDTSGGLYHIVRLTLAGKTGEFSGQQKTNILGLQSASIRSRLEVVNQIARVFNQYVETSPKTKPAESSAETKKSTP
ncbi:MAG: hypothetical protein V3W41_21145 [Planctomycetota bacterium]